MRRLSLCLWEGAKVGLLRATLAHRCSTLSAATSPSTASHPAAPKRGEATGPAGQPSPHGGNATTITAGPYRCVGNIFIVHCVDHPFKFGWEVNRMLRELRLEFMGQTTIVPDVPEVRKRLWRVRHVVRVDMLDLDEAKALIGVPEHISFSDLNAQIPATFGRGKGTSSPVIRSKVNFMRFRRMRMRDVMHRDELEKRLLEEKRKILEKEKGNDPPHKQSIA